MSQYIEINKLDSARRQLETAITLFLNFKDEISTHTLASAATGILRDLSNIRDKKSFFEEAITTRVKKEFQKEFIDMLNEAKNYLKHANQDHDKILKFYLGQTEFILYDGCYMYRQLTRENVPIFMVFEFWFYNKYFEGVENKELVDAIKKLNIGIEERKRFLDLLPYYYHMEASSNL